MILCTELGIDAADLPEELRDYKAEPQRNEPLSFGLRSLAHRQSVPTLSELEGRYICEVLNATGQNKTHAARILGIHPTSLMQRPKKLEEVG
jgi:DNA-binding NtrC family response regulator